MLTYELLEECVPHASDGDLKRFIKPLNAAMEKYKINNYLRQAAFLAQIAHESGSFHYLSEIASGKAYEGRKDLGNTLPEAIEAAEKAKTTPGRFYKGHGLIQITGYYNHKLCGEALGLDLINEPYLLLMPEHAAASAAWFWETHDCNQWADLDNILKITRIINGGTNGLSQRTEFYERNKKILLREKRR